MRDRRPARAGAPRRRAALAALGLGLLAGPGLAPGGAAWTDDVHVAATAGAGSWPAAPGGETCEVVRVADQRVDPAYACALVVRDASWDPGAEPPLMHLVLDVRYVLPPGVHVLPADRQVRFATTLALPGEPAWWVWDRAVVSASTTPAPTLTSACADLPRVAGTLAPGHQWGVYWSVSMGPGPGGALCRASGAAFSDGAPGPG